ncbi:MAG: hypothetical protein KF862_02665 [Chitinophagaceae bacterium]|nr:hypothetical protein [Chitinophagaceae bacterium]
MKKSLIAIAVAGLTLFACKRDSHHGNGKDYKPGTPPGEVKQWIHQASEKSTTVPSDFVGMHLHRWPNIAEWEIEYGGEPSPKPPFPYGARRLWNYADATAWCAVDVGYMQSETNEDRYWPMLDEVMNTEAAEGHKLMITINGTPKTLSSHPERPGAYPGWPGHQYAPKDAAAFDKLRKYVADLVARYGNKLSYIDTNNEPDPENPIPEEKNYWVGTKQEHAEWHRMQRLAVPRGDNAPLLIGPSMVVWDWEQNKAHEYSLSVLTAEDSEGTRLIDHLDAYGFHYYTWPDADPIEYWQTLTAVKATLKAAGKEDMAIYDTEHGALDGMGWNDESRQQQAIQVLRHSIIAAGFGVKMIAWYSGDGNNLGQPSNGGAVSDALTKVYNDLTGLEVYETAILDDGRCWIRGIKDRKTVEFIY